MAKAGTRIAVPLLAVLFGFAVGALVIVATGKSPLSLGQALLRVLAGVDASGNAPFNPYYIGEFLLQSMPIILTGLSIGFAFRTGLFNIGAEGQLMMGALAATCVALLVPAGPVVHVLLCLAAAAAAGAFWGAIPGYLKARFNVHEVVVTIMLNYVALHFCNWGYLLFGSADRVKTQAFPASASLKSAFLTELTRGSRLNWGILVVAAALVLYWFAIEKTTFGFGLRATGFNKDAARYAGMKVERNVVMSMVISGAFAGLAGAVITLGTFNFGRVIPAMEGYGMDGIAVALVGENSAPGILLSGLLFGLLKAAQPLMQTRGIPREIAGIIQSSIVLFVAMRLGFELVLDALKKKGEGRP